MQEKKLSILSKYKEKLSGAVTIPIEKKNLSEAIILVHGFGQNRSEYGLFDDLAVILADSGYFVYRFDFSGCGDSEGNFTSMTVSKEISELSSIYDFVKEKGHNKINLICHSLGTAIAIALCPDANSFIFTSSVSCPKKNFIKYFGDGIKLNGLSKKLRSDGRITAIGKDFWKDLDKFDFPRLIRKINAPILFIHGKEDNFSPLSEMESYYENARSRKDKIIILGAGHDFSPKRKDMYIAVANWLKKKNP